MAERQSGRDAVQQESQIQTGPMQYPTHHVVAIVDTPGQTSCALDALLGGGFLEFEVDVNRGADDADRLAAAPAVEACRTGSSG